jgi:hypothetical protein
MVAGSLTFLWTIVVFFMHIEIQYSCLKDMYSIGALIAQIRSDDLKLRLQIGGKAEQPKPPTDCGAGKSQGDYRDSFW